MDQTIGDFGKSIVYFTENLLQKINLTGDFLVIIRTLIILIGAVFFCILLWWATRKILITIIHKLADKSKTMWDDYLVGNKFFAAIANLVPLLFIDSFVKTVFVDYPKIGDFFIKASDVAIVFVVLIGILRFLKTFQQILSEKEKLKDKPIQSYFQLIKIIIIGFMIILGLSIATGQSPIYFLTSLGAMTAIILLIFKDTILGFVGSILVEAAANKQGLGYHLLNSLKAIERGNVDLNILTGVAFTMIFLVLLSQHIAEYVRIRFAPQSLVKR